MILTKLLSLLTAIIAFFANTFAATPPSEQPLDGGERLNYGSAYNQQYDIYIPQTITEDTDLLFMIHGGAWVACDQTLFSDYAKTACDEYGMIAVTMTYRKLQNGASAEDINNDVIACLDHVQNYLSQKDITPDKMIVVGHSAGANISMLYAFNHYEDSPYPIAFIVDACGPSDFFQKSERKTTMGNLKYVVTSFLTAQAITPLNKSKHQDAINAISPVTMITADVPPVFVIAAGKDTMVPYENSKTVYEKLTQAGVYTEFLEYENSDHFLKEQQEELAEQRTEIFERFYEMFA